MTSSRKFIGMMLVGLSLGLGGCESSPTEPEEGASFFRATINGVINASYEGTGDFFAGTDPRRPVAPTSFSLFSRGKGSSENQTFQIFRPSAEQPRPGKYSLGVQGADFQAHFSRTGNHGETMEAFAASSGELEITVSRADRIEGKFRMSGFRFCLRDPNAPRGMVVNCTVPTAVAPGAPTIEVSGSFVALPFSGTIELR